MIGFDQAIEQVKALARPLGVEALGIAAAEGRVLAEPVVAAMAAPPVDASAMDGYAVHDADLEALPARLRVIGESLAGRGFEGTLAPGGCARIFTGAPIPAGADRVVIQEVVRPDGDFAWFDSPPGAGRHIRPVGSDFRAGEVLLPAGARLGPRQLVTAAAADTAELVVHRLPRLIILATGDELAAPGTARARPGAIPESVSFGVAALARAWGGEVVGTRRLGDELAPLEAAGREALEAADLVVVTGGASVGERDYAKRLFGDALDLVFSKVAIKPGKPAWLGRARGKLVLGLPGNPTSAMVTARLFLAPLLAGLSGGAPDAALAWRQAPLINATAATGDRETFSRGRLEGGAVRILSNQDSSAQKTLAQSDALVRLRAGRAAAGAGTQADIIDF